MHMTQVYDDWLLDVYTSKSATHADRSTRRTLTAQLMHTPRTLIARTFQFRLAVTDTVRAMVPFKMRSSEMFRELKLFGFWMWKQC